MGLRKALDSYLSGVQAAQWAAARDRKETVGAACRADEQVCWRPRPLRTFGRLRKAAGALMYCTRNFYLTSPS